MSKGTVCRHRHLAAAAAASVALGSAACAPAVADLGEDAADTPSASPSPSESPTERTATATVILLDQTVEEIGPADDPSGTAILNTVFQTEFVGDLEGNGYHVYLDIVDADQNATSEGAGRFVGSLDGLTGTFVMTATGTADAEGAISAEWCVVEDSATAELEGLSGCGEILTTGSPEAQVTLDYTLPGTD